MPYAVAIASKDSPACTRKTYAGIRFERSKRRKIIPYSLGNLLSTFFRNKGRFYSYCGWYKYTHKWNYSKGSRGLTRIRSQSRSRPPQNSRPGRMLSAAPVRLSSRLTRWCDLPVSGCQGLGFREQGRLTRWCNLPVSGGQGLGFREQGVMSRLTRW